MKNKNLVLATLFAFTAFGMALQSYAATRSRYMVPVNQAGIPDSYALPCKPSTTLAADNTAITPVASLDEAGMVYWVSITPKTADDYVIFRDSNTANSSSTELARFSAHVAATTTFIQFNPPMAVSNGLSINVSSQTTTATVCIREADGDL